VQDIGAHGVDGIALTKDGKTAYLYSQFDHRLISFSGKGKDASSFITKDRELQVQDNSEFGRDPIRVAGRKLFFDAANQKLSSAQTNVACSSCHLEGREDGHVWQFPDGARQTPALGGRKLLSTAPFHWSGEFDTIAKFNTHTITERMGGKGLSLDEAGQLDTFIDTMPLADNPLRGSAASLRGEQAFTKAGCDTCHTGALLTNNANRDVGTTRLSGTNPDNGPVVTSGFNVPSLLGAGRTAPYLHDGSSLTLSARVFTSDTRHGNTTVLNDQEKNDLLVYLRSL
jgi:cytochrome c peroxidase